MLYLKQKKDVQHEELQVGNS